MNRKELKSLTKEQLEGKRGLLALIIFIVFLINIACSFVTKDMGFSLSWILVSLVVSMASVVIHFGVSMVHLNVVKGKDVNVYDIFSGFKGKIIFKIVGLQLLISLATGLAMILLIVPGIIVALMLSQSAFILMEDENKGIIECMKESARMMKGYKGNFFILQLSFIGWILFVAITCGFGSLYAVPYMYAVNANYYLHLKNKTEDIVDIF